MRLIDADEMIAKYGDWYTEEGPEDGFIGTLKGVVNMMPTIEPQRWIPVTKELPKKKDEYLVTYHPCYWDNVEDDVKEVGIDSFRGKESWAKSKYQKVVAWAEKPEPWEGE